MFGKEVCKNITDYKNMLKFLGKVGAIVGDLKNALIMLVTLAAMTGYPIPYPGW